MAGSLRSKPRDDERAYLCNPVFNLMSKPLSVLIKCAKLCDPSAKISWAAPASLMMTHLPPERLILLSCRAIKRRNDLCQYRAQQVIPPYHLSSQSSCSPSSVTLSSPHMRQILEVEIHLHARHHNDTTMVSVVVVVLNIGRIHARNEGSTTFFSNSRVISFAMGCLEFNIAGKSGPPRPSLFNESTKCKHSTGEEPFQ